MQLKNLGNFISLIDEFKSVNDILEMSAGGFNALENSLKGLSATQILAKTSTLGLTDAQKLELIQAFATDAANYSNATSFTALSASEEVTKGTTLGLSSAFKGLWATLSANPLILVTAAVTAGITAWNAYKQHIEEVRQSTAEAANTFKESASSIDEYASRYQELRQALLEAKGNEEETYGVKKQLLDLQTELNDKFGEEYGKINLVTDAYKNQTEAIKNYNKEAANAYLNENEKGIRTATKKMTGENHYNLSLTGISSVSDEGKALQELVSKYADQGMTILDEMGNGSQFSIHLTADPQSAYDTINAFESDVRNKAKELGDEHMFDDILDISSSALNDAKSIIDDWGEQYRTSLLSQIAVDDSLSDGYNKAIKAVEDYNDAVLKSEDPYSDENVAKARQNLQSMHEELNGEEWKKYSSVVQEVFDEADTSLYDFNQALKNDSGLKALAKDLEGLNNLDLQSFEQNIGENISFDKLKESAEKYGVSVENLIDSLVRLGYVQGEVSSSEIAPTPIDPWTPTESIQKMGELNDILDKVDASMADFVENGKHSVDVLNDLATEESIQNLESFDDFINTMSDSASTTEEISDAYNTLVDEIIRTNGYLQGLDQTNKDVITSSLEEMGVINAEEVVMAELGFSVSDYAQAKREAALAGVDLFNATDEEIQMLINENIVSQETANSLAYYLFQKQLANANSLDTSQSCASLIMLANNAGVTGDILEDLIRLEQIHQQVESGTLSPASLEHMLAEADALSASIKAQATKFQTAVKPIAQYNGGAKTYTANQNKMKDATNKATDAIKEQKEALEKEKEALEDQKDTMDKLASAISSFYDKKIDKLNDEKEAIQDNIQSWEDLGDAIQWFLDGKTDELDKFIDKLNDANDVLQDQLEDMDSILSVIDRVYSDEIDLIQEKIDKLDEANDEKEKEIALEEARIALEEARNRKSVMLYQKGIGFTYTVDQKAIKDAESNLADLEAEAENDAIKEALQEQIDKLQELKDAFAEIPDSYKKSLEEMEAIAKYGTNYKDVILGSDMTSVDNLKGEYTGIQKEQDSNNAQIDLYENQKKQIEEIMDFWDSATRKWEEDQNRMKLVAFFGSDYESSIMDMSMAKWNEYVSEYEAAQNRLSDVEAQITSLERLKAEWEDAANAYEESQNRAALVNFFGSDYEYQLLNNSSTWREKFAADYASICDQIKAKEAEIAALSESTTSDVATSAGQASDALGGTSQALSGLHQTAASGDSISKYIWSEEDGTALSDAQAKLDEINNLLAFHYSPSLADAKNKLEDFVGSYSGLEDSRIKTDDLTNSLSALQGSENEYISDLQGILDGVSTRLGDSSNYTQEIASNTQNASDSLNNLNTALQSIQSSEENVEKDVDDTVSDVNSKVSSAVENIGKLNDALNELDTTKQALESTVESAVSDASNVIGDSQTKVQEIKNATDELLSAVTSLQAAIMELLNAMQALDATQLSNVIAQVGFVDDGSSLCGSVWAVINTIRMDLIEGALAELNAQNTDLVSEEFNGEADSLLSSIKDVTNAIYSEGNDECLIARIKKITETITQIRQVENAFYLLEMQTLKCRSEVEKLNEQIQSMKDKHVYIYTHHISVDGYATGTAFTGKGYAAGTANDRPKAIGKSYASGNWGLPQDEKDALLGEVGTEILVRNGQYFTINKPTRMDLKRGDIIFNSDQSKAILERGKASNIDHLEKLGWEKINPMILNGKSFALGTDNSEYLKNIMEYSRNNPIPLNWNIPTVATDYSKYFNDNRKTTTTELHFHGDLSFPNIHSGDDAQKLIADLKTIGTKALQRANKR